MAEDDGVPLSHGWFAFKADDGDEYYFNNETQETVWDLPEKVEDPRTKPKAEEVPKQSQPSIEAKKDAHKPIRHSDADEELEQRRISAKQKSERQIKVQEQAKKDQELKLVQQQRHLEQLKIEEAEEQAAHLDAPKIANPVSSSTPTPTPTQFSADMEMPTDEAVIEKMYQAVLENLMMPASTIQKLSETESKEKKWKMITMHGKQLADVSIQQLVNWNEKDQFMLDSLVQANKQLRPPSHDLMQKIRSSLRQPTKTWFQTFLQNNGGERASERV